MMVDKADNPINSGMHAGCVDDALVSMDLSEEERTKLLHVMAKAKVLFNYSLSPPTRAICINKIVPVCNCATT